MQPPCSSGTSRSRATCASSVLGRPSFIRRIRGLGSPRCSLRSAGSMRPSDTLKPPCGSVRRPITPTRYPSRCSLSASPTTVTGLVSWSRAVHESPLVDPTETSVAQDFRSAKALFVPSLKAWYRPFYRHAHDLRREGSQGHPHPTARIHIHTGRCGGRVAARGARAAAEGADHRRAGYWQYKPGRILAGVSAGVTRSGVYRGAEHSI